MTPSSTIWMRDEVESLSRMRVLAVEGNYELYLFSFRAWLELGAIILGNAALSAFSGLIVYRYIVESRRSSKPGIGGASAQAIVVATGLILPFWVFSPKYLADILHLNNITFRFCFCVMSPTTSLFRTIEALFGFTPPHAMASEADFVLNYTSICLLSFDKKANKYVYVKLMDVAKRAMTFFAMLFVTGLTQSAFQLSDYFPTLGGGLTSPPPGWFESSTVLDIRLWGDSIMCGFLFLMYITTLSEGLALVTHLLTGLQTDRVNIYPLIASNSPSDFWGRRWNRIVHACLKGGAYKPVRSLTSSHTTGTAAAFIASGLFHEWALVGTMPNYDVVYGPTTLFFVWQAGLLIVEVLTKDWYLWSLLGESVPQPFKSLCLVVLGAPLGHFFVEPYVHSDMFPHGSVLFPSIKIAS